ncbi:MAG TPA: FAD-dependent oxidoreductase [Candidatus Nanoarchaeia archaeon]|nr:FAD-dependent oxidoreductase [Candidatus Nanoarchaeia archaeon]
MKQRKEIKNSQEKRNNPERRRIVIIGGGFAGSFAVKKLEKHFAVTLIDEKDYFEFTPSILKTLVNHSLANAIQVQHSHYLHHAQIVKGSVSKIEEDVVFVGKKKYPFDYLLIASGSRYASPIKEKNLVIASRAQELRYSARKLSKAEHILIIGGGIVGVELAAEIICAFPDKKVKIVHARKELMERTPAKARAYSRSFLEKRGVTILFDKRVVESNGKYQTDTKKALSCDIAFLCTGIMPNYEHLGICSTQINERKFLCVNEFLQVAGRKHIFAAGDVNDVAEEKTAQAAEKQAAAVVRNIFCLEQKKPLHAYSPSQKPMVISLGKYDGLFMYKELVVSGLLPALLKWLIERKTMWRYRWLSFHR